MLKLFRSEMLKSTINTAKLLTLSVAVSSTALFGAGAWDQSNPIEPAYSDAKAQIKLLEKSIKKMGSQLDKTKEWSLNGYKVKQRVYAKSELCTPAIMLSVSQSVGTTKQSTVSIIDDARPLPLATVGAITRETKSFGYALTMLGKYPLLVYKTAKERDTDLALLQGMKTLCKEYKKNQDIVEINKGSFSSLALASEEEGILIPNVKDEMVGSGGFKTHLSSESDAISMALLKGKESFAMRWSQLEKIENSAVKKTIKIQVLHWGGDEAGVVLGEKLIQLKQKGHNPIIYIDSLSPFSDVRNFNVKLDNARLYARMMAAGIPIYGYDCSTLNSGFLGNQAEDMIQASNQIEQENNNDLDVDNVDDVLMHWRKNMHEKIWSVEGEYPIMGGMNILNAYFSLTPEGSGYWKDQDFIIKSSRVARELTSIIDRNIANYKSFYKDPKTMSCFNPHQVTDARYVQFFNERMKRIDRVNKINSTLTFGKIGGSKGNGSNKYTGFEGYDPTSSGVDESTFKSANEVIVEINRLKLGMIQEVRKTSDGQKYLTRNSLNPEFFPVAGFRSIPNRPKWGEHFISDALIQIIDQAKEELWLVNAYFIPSTQLSDAIKRAVARGVNVSIITNADNTNDLPIMTPVQRSLYKNLMDVTPELSKLNMYEWTGTDIFGEQRRGMLHAKYVVADRRVVMGGSYNLDNTSENINSEIVMVTDSVPLAMQMIKNLDTDFLPFTKKIGYGDAINYKYPSTLSGRAMLYTSILMKNQF